MFRTMSILMLVLLISLHTNCGCDSFQPLSLFIRSTRSTASSPSEDRPFTTKHRKRRYSANTHFYADPSSTNVHDQTPPPPSFEQRMREQLKRHRSATSPPSTMKGHSSSKLVPNVQTLQEYKDVLVQTGEDGKMMAVLWYSPWCKACRAVLPGIRTLAKRHPDVQFIQVPVLAENANLHQGLDVPSVPFLHLYVPEDPRLVEEKKMTRKRLSAFQRLLLDYERGSCSLEQMSSIDGREQDVMWSTDCPYSLPNQTNGTSTLKLTTTP